MFQTHKSLLGADRYSKGAIKFCLGNVIHPPARAVRSPDDLENGRPFNIISC